jgi:hypothetical protein
MSRHEMARDCTSRPALHLSMLGVWGVGGLGRVQTCRGEVHTCTHTRKRVSKRRLYSVYAYRTKERVRLLKRCTFFKGDGKASGFLQGESERRRGHKHLCRSLQSLRKDLCINTSTAAVSLLVLSRCRLSVPIKERPKTCVRLRALCLRGLARRVNVTSFCCTQNMLQPHRFSSNG